MANRVAASGGQPVRWSQQSGTIRNYVKNMAPKNNLKLRNGPKSDDMKITLRVNGRIDHPKASGGSIEGLNVADKTVDIGFRGNITEFTVHRGEGSASISDGNGNSRDFSFNELEGYDTRNGVGGSASDGEEDESVVDKISDVLDGGDGASNDASGTWNPQTGGSDRDLDPKHAVVDRPFISKRDRTVIVGKGGDVGTISEALNRMPRVLEHEYHIKLKKGVHGNEPGNGLNTAPTDVSAAHGSFKIIGDTDNPRDYVIDVKQANFHFNPGTAQNASIEGVHLRGTFQMRSRLFEIDNCVISAGDRWNKGDSVPVDGYGGHLQILGETVLEAGDVAFNFVEDMSIGVHGDCTIDADTALCSSGQSGGTLIFNGSPTISCNGKITHNWEPGAVRVIDTHEATDGLQTGRHAVRLG